MRQEQMGEEQRPEPEEPQTVPPPGAPPATATGETQEERTWGMMCHLLALLGFVGVPFGNIIGPLVVWLIKREESAFIDQQGKASLNFQISLWIYGIVGGVICAILTLVVIGIFLGILFFAGIVIFGVVMVIIASVKASKGEPFQYPLALPLLR
jgi:hypothetical protein